MTIEERAEAYKQKIQDEASSEGVEILSPNAYYAGYKQGATEQRAIDEEKAITAYCACCYCGCEIDSKKCERLKEFLHEYKKNP